MLYRPEAFEPLVDTPWSELRARAAIRDIVEDTDSAFRGPRLFWRADDWDGWHGTSPMKNLYVGTAGVLWALDHLRQRGHTETKLDLASLATRNVELFRERPDFMKGEKLPAQRESALLTGETGRTQRLYGQELRGLTPPHGLVGNVQALLPLLDEDRADALKRESAALLAANAVQADGLANWPPRPRPELPGPDGQIRVQWCAGAPGIVAGAAEYLDVELLRAGAELPWRTGPPALEKGPGICHGTAGNGYAFLKVFARTADERWLERGRRFAMHALAQVERLRAERGRGRYSLWTGDVGAAVYAADCIAGTSAYPILDGI